MFEAPLNSYAINELPINGNGFEEIALPEAVASLVLGGSLDGALLETIAGESLAAMQFDGEGSLTVSPGSTGIAGMVFAGQADMTLNGSSTGISRMLMELQALPTLNSSSEGVAGIDLVAIADITVSGGKDSGGVAAMVLGAQIDPYVWTYFYPGGMAPMAMTGIVNRDYRPPLPATFYPALERFQVGDDTRLGEVRPDNDTMLVPEGRQRLEVPEER